MKDGHVERESLPPSAATIALAGNPNSGKTTLFNQLTGLNAKTSNFPGTTVEHHIGRMVVDGVGISVLDLPGLYSLEAVTLEEQQARAALRGEIQGLPVPDLTVLILDATNLERNLFLAGQILELGQRAVVALNMTDLAAKCGIRINRKQLEKQLGCPVVPIVARRGEGIDLLRRTIHERLMENQADAESVTTPRCCSCHGCPYAARYDWAEKVGVECTSSPLETHGRGTERIDRILTHPVVGLLCFFSVMAIMFTMIFAIAEYPMHWIESGMAWMGAMVSGFMPAGDFRSLIVDGVIGGVGGILVFLPQIAILFMFITLLEDTGYLSRAAFVMDRLMRRVGLPGKAFVPMLTAHACAVPGIMATRVIEDHRDRLVTILILPLMTCSARLPVYTMILALLFPERPVVAGLLFTGLYALGLIGAMLTSFLLKRTVLPGEVRPLIIELPHYRIPCLRTAMVTTFQQSMVFIRKAGTVILLISVILWCLAHYPSPPEPVAGRSQQVLSTDVEGTVQDLASKSVSSSSRLEYSLAGRIGKWLEPVFEPLGFNWQINVGVISSFAAREVIVSTLAIVYGAGEDSAEDQAALTDVLRSHRRSDGSPVFNVATSLSLLIFYAFAMQCIPTQVITHRETGKWRWVFLQFIYMSLLAWFAAMLTYQGVSWLMPGV